jgi:ADP-ribosylglycohydrolase
VALIVPLKRFEGALLGLATGDALGAWTEDMLPSGIRGHFGGQLKEFPIGKEHPLYKNGKYHYTWETKIAMDIATSLIENKKLSPKDIAEKLVGWSLDQTVIKPLPITYMRAARLVRHNCDESMSTGQPSLCSTGASRTVPVALFFNGLTQKSVEAAINVTDITHSSEDAHAAAAALTMFLSLLLKGIEPYEAFESMCKTIESSFYDFSKNVLAPVMSYQNFDHEAAFNCIGLKNDLTQIIPSAFYCFLKYKNNFKEAVCCAVNRGGKSNCTASITGALAGIYLGSDSIPDSWQSSLFEKESITSIAGKIYKLSTEQ